MFHRPRQDAPENGGDKKVSSETSRVEPESKAENKSEAEASIKKSETAYSSAPGMYTPASADGNKSNTVPDYKKSYIPENKQESNAEDKSMNNENKDNQNKNISQSQPGSYQPPAAGMPGGYGVGAYPGAGSSSTDTAGQGNRLIIGQGITMSGEIESCEYLVVEGTVEAALKGAKVLEIAENGTFYGTVEIEEATIAGRFEGDITVSGRLVVTSSGSITGTISYSELAVEAGATLDGKISPLGAKGDQKSSPKKDKSKEKSSGKDNAAARNDNKGEDKSDESELPFVETATAAAE